MQVTQALLEERKPIEHMPGYAGYAKRTKRFLPIIV